MIDPRQKTDTSGVARSVDGRVMRGTRKSEDPVANQWVVLHRVGRDRAGPIDSTRTTADGRFHMRYRATGDSSALYLVSTKFDAIAYYSSPFRAAVVRGDDATLTVFDTTSGPVAIQLAARHLVIGMVQPNGRRPVVEVYDLKNDSTVTLIPRDSTTPVFTAHVPPTAVDFQLNASGDLAPDAISRRGTTVSLFVPLSPGIRQMAFNYELPSKDFPLTIPIDRTTGVFEIMIQEPTARVTGVALREMPPASAEGRVFRRFLAQDIPASSVISIDMPRLIGPEREKVYAGVGLSMLMAMLLALVFASRSRLPHFARRQVAKTESASRVLVRTIAALDAEHERVSPADDAARAAYASKRAALKAELTTVMAAEQRS